MIGKAHKKWQFESADKEETEQANRDLKTRRAIPAGQPGRVHPIIASGAMHNIRQARRQDNSREQFGTPHPNWASAEQSEEPTSAPHVKKIYSVGDSGKGQHHGNTIGKSNLTNPLFQKGIDTDHAVATSDADVKDPDITDTAIDQITNPLGFLDAKKRERNKNAVSKMTKTGAGAILKVI